MPSTISKQPPFPAVGELISSHEAIPPTMQVNDVADRFFTSRELDSIALVDEGHVYGLATRAKSFAILFRRFGFELFGRDPIIEIADRNPLIVTEGEDLNATLERAMARSYQDIYDEVVVVDGAGRFKGLLSVKQMVVAQGSALKQCAREKETTLACMQEMRRIHVARLDQILRVAREADHRSVSSVGIVRLMAQAMEKGQYQWAGEELALLADAVADLQDKIGNILDLSRSGSTIVQDVQD